MGMLALPEIGEKVLWILLPEMRCKFLMKFCRRAWNAYRVLKMICCKSMYDRSGMRLLFLSWTDKVECGMISV